MVLLTITVPESGTWKRDLPVPLLYKTLTGLSHLVVDEAQSLVRQTLQQRRRSMAAGNFEPQDSEGGADADRPDPRLHWFAGWPPGVLRPPRLDLATQSYVFARDGTSPHPWSEAYLALRVVRRVGAILPVPPPASSGGLEPPAVHVALLPTVWVRMVVIPAHGKPAK